jgi:hypothetical protein
VEDRSHSRTVEHKRIACHAVEAEISVAVGERLADCGPTGIVLMSHRRAVLSHDAVTIRVPSRLKAAEMTGPLCPLSVTTVHPDASTKLGTV